MIKRIMDHNKTRVRPTSSGEQFVLDRTISEVVDEPGSGDVIQLIFDNDDEHIAGYRKLCILLDPPAAQQIARDLRKAVKRYLNHTPETESRSTDSSD